jgi:hypothetical protein
LMIDENVKIKCTKMLAGISRAGAEKSAMGSRRTASTAIG